MKFNSQLLKKLVSIPSTSNNLEKKLEVLRLIEKSFNKNLIVKRYDFGERPALVFSNVNSKNLDLILSTHADVVSADNKQFCLTEKGDRLYGRGTYDMKATMVACLQLLEEFVKKGVSKKVAVFVTTDEESDGLSTRYLLGRVGYKAKFAIIPDGGGDCKISVEQKGFLQVSVKFVGKSAHASEPWNGDNPIDSGIEFYERLKKIIKNPQKKNDWRTSAVLTKVVSGESTNQIPGDATFFFDVRFVPGEKMLGVLKKLKGILPKNASIDVVSQNEAYLVDRNNEFLKGLSSSIKKVRKKRVEYVKDCSTSDAIFFAENETPAVLLRPLGANPHMEKEWISKKSLMEFAEIINDFLVNFKS